MSHRAVRLAEHYICGDARRATSCAFGTFSSLGSSVSSADGPLLSSNAVTLLKNSNVSLDCRP